MTSLLKFAFRYRNIVNYTECKRFAGHNKWSNIRHTKMARDGERASALQILIKKMKIAIAGILFLTIVYYLLNLYVLFRF